MAVAQEIEGTRPAGAVEGAGERRKPAKYETPEACVRALAIAIQTDDVVGIFHCCDREYRDRLVGRIAFDVECHVTLRTDRAEAAAELLRDHDVAGKNIQGYVKASEARQRIGGADAALTEIGQTIEDQEEFVLAAVEFVPFVKDARKRAAKKVVKVDESKLPKFELLEKKMFSDAGGEYRTKDGKLISHRGVVESILGLHKADDSWAVIDESMP